MYKKKEEIILLGALHNAHVFHVVPGPNFQGLLVQRTLLGRASSQGHISEVLFVLSSFDAHSDCALSPKLRSDLERMLLYQEDL